MAGPLLARRGCEASSLGTAFTSVNGTRATATLLDFDTGFGSFEGTTRGATIEVNSPVQFNYPDPVDILYDAYAAYWYWDPLPAGEVYIYVRPTTLEGRRSYFSAAVAPGLPTDVVQATTWLRNDGINDENADQYFGLLPCIFKAVNPTEQPCTLFVYSFDASLDENEGYGEGMTGPATFKVGWGHSDDPEPSHWLPEQASTTAGVVLHDYLEPGILGTNSWQDWLVGNGYRATGGWPSQAAFHPDRVWGWKYTSTTGDLPTQHWLPYYGFDFWS